MPVGNFTPVDAWGRGMTFSKQLAASLGALLMLSGLTVAPAWGHSRNVAALQVRGLVTGVGGNSLHIQTATTGMTFTLTGTTRITRIVTGSTADLANGEIIEAQFATGTTTIKSIRIDAAHTNRPTGPSTRHDGLHDGDHVGTGSRTGRSGSTSAKSGWHPPTGVDGQLVSMTSKTVTVRGDRGTATYPLTDNVVVTKVLPGKLSDLAMGETVQVCTGRGNATAAVTVTILSS
jgi:hypothetical protein